MSAERCALDGGQGLGLLSKERRLNSFFCPFFVLLLNTISVFLSFLEAFKTFQLCEASCVFVSPIASLALRNRDYATCDYEIVKVEFMIGKNKGKIREGILNLAGLAVSIHSEISIVPHLSLPWCSSVLSTLRIPSGLGRQGEYYLYRPGGASEWHLMSLCGS
jgi:hypothetical protein